MAGVSDGADPGEIGLRMAVGRRVRRDILRQFLIEAVLLCVGWGHRRNFDRTRSLAGGDGVAALAHFAPRCRPSWARGWRFSLTVGIIFGYYPRPGRLPGWIPSKRCGMSDYLFSPRGRCKLVPQFLH